MRNTILTKILCGIIVGVGVAGVAFATVTGTYTPSRVSADGNTTAYSFSFKVPAKSDLVVELVNTTTLAVTNQTLASHYNVTLSKSTPGGHIDFVTAPAVGNYVQMYRNISATQPTDIPAGGLFREVQIENALDRSVLLIQQQQEQLSRAIKFPIGSNTTEIAFPAPVANTVIRWNSAGTALENEVLTDLSAVAKATGTEINTGTDDAKFVTAKALADAGVTKETDTDYSALSTVVGWDTAQAHTFQIRITKVGSIVFFSYYLTGVSNATTISFTVPYTATNFPVAFGGPTNDSVDNNTAVGQAGYCSINRGANAVSVFPTVAGGTWTASGTKTVRGQGWFIGS